MASLPDKLGHLGPVIETHSAWVFLGERFVLKTKKPVDLGFLDFSTLERRQAMCEAEVRLNRRLAPSVYLDVVRIFEKEGATFVDDPQVDPKRPEDTTGATLVDFGVKMRRLSENQRADLLLDRGVLDLSFAELVADTIAEFHRKCPSSPEIARFGSREAVKKSVAENFEQARPLLTSLTSELDAAENYQRSFLETQSDLFLRRVEQGFVRDGHGDLRLEHLYLEGGELLVIDCIEFNDRFRYADVASDLAFLTMDLRHLHRDEWAERMIAQYVRRTRDYELYKLVDFYESYRAFVRAKVTAILREQTKGANRAASLDDAIENYCKQAAAPFSKRAERPRVICVGGLIASGKSTVCERLRKTACPVVIDSDTTRKHLHGVQPDESCHDPAFEGMYSEQRSQRVYETMERDARLVLGSGRSVIIEASFSKRQERARFSNLAKECGADLYFVECRIPDEVARERLRRRAITGGVSDGRLEIYDAFVAGYQALSPDESERQLVLETGRPEAQQDDELSAFLGTPPKTR